jgi:arginase
MALSILTGGAWGALRATIPGVRAVAEEHVALLGVRDLSDGQAARVARCAAQVAPGAFDADAARAAIARLPGALYLHIDLDVLDTSVGRANRFAAPGGPTLETVLATVDASFAHGHVIAAALTAYEPQSDKPRTIQAAARTVAARIATRALAQRGRRGG